MRGRAFRSGVLSARFSSEISRISLSPSIHQTVSGRKRFYKYVTVEPVPEAATTPASSISTSTDYRILLDGRTLRTPARAPLHLPSRHLALAVAAEWDAQTCPRMGIQPTTMPLMTLASTAIDQVHIDPTPVQRTVLSYLPTDSVLFFTTTEDRILLKKQKQHFSPLHKWLQRAFQAEVKTTSTFAGRLQHPPITLARMQSAVASLSDKPFHLACLQGAVRECRSLVLGLALLCGEVCFSFS